MNKANEIENISIAVRAICSIQCNILLATNVIPIEEKGIAQLHFLSLSNTLTSKLSRKRNASYILKAGAIESKINLGNGSDKVFTIELIGKNFKVCSL